ncbi:uncharacterized protein zgc:194210 isoform X2 [Silurus meridionalis]|uniref:uncharacterized protein zgc:194210 isoform X2 n=1 Tax=Silurus meridionalis TaxID=175797 RepID=UPI001EEADF80|nr:uncharacterized protein zgc:194210 isoform X2 [Silurus meridionalis]
MISCWWILQFKMRQSGSCVRSVLSMLVFITVVYSAAMRGQNEDFVNFLNAFNRASPGPAVVPVSDPSNPAGVPDSVAVCSTSTPGHNTAELDSVEHAADEKSKENSNSADRTEDYDHRSSNKKNKVTETLGLDNDSTESKSTERTHMDKYVETEIKKQPVKTQGLSAENRSSQELYEPWDSVKDQERKRRMDTERGGEEHRETPTTQTDAIDQMNSYLADQTQVKERKIKDKIKQMRENSDSPPLSDSQNIIDQSQECMEVSSWVMRYPYGENTSVGGEGIDPQSEEGITNDEHQPRKLCSATKRLSKQRPQREQLDTDSEERVNSELLDRDRDNSSERMLVQAIYNEDCV